MMPFLIAVAVLFAVLVLYDQVVFGLARMLTAWLVFSVLLFSAPFIIMRNTLIGRRHEGRRFEFVFAATLIAGFWSLMSGTVVVAALRVSGAL